MKTGVGMRNLLAAFALVGSTTGAFAADVAAPSQYRAPVAAVSPAYNWSGFYIGAMGGYGWSNSATVGNVAVTDANLKGGFGGATIGYNYQAPGSMFVFGMESDVAWSDIGITERIGALTATEKVTAFGTTTARLGIAIDTVLLYGKGGYGWALNEISGSVPGLTASESHFHNGWTVGGGAEFAFAGPWSAKAEYMFASYLAENYSGTNLALDVHTFKAGINYRFNWGTPVVAKY